MGRRLNHSTPTVINTELVPFDESFFISADGQLEQWYYDNSTTYAPNRKLTPLILTPRLSVYDKETTLSYGTDAGTLSFYTVGWYSLEYRDSSGSYAERPITNVTDNPTAEYVINGFSLIVKKNVSYSHGVTIRCVATYIDPRDAGKTYTTQATVLLTTNRDAKVVLPEVSIISPSARGFNPLTDYDNQGHQLSQFEFKGAINNSPERASSTEVQAYRIDGGGTEEILPDNNGSMETCAPVMDIVYPGGSVETDASFMFRKTAGGDKPNMSGTAFVNNLKGNCVRFNQLADNGDFSETENLELTMWESYNASIKPETDGGVFVRSDGGGGYMFQEVNVASERTYYMSAILKTEATASLSFGINGERGIDLGGNTTVTTESSEFVKIYQVTSPSNIGTNALCIYVGGGKNSSCTVMSVMLIDLTAMFGTDQEIESVLGPIGGTLFDANLTSWLGQNVGLQRYYDYLSKGCLSVKIASIRTVGFNVWDGTLSETGKYIDVGGAVHTLAHYGVTNFIKVIPGASYYQNNTDGSGSSAVCFYDEDMNYISGTLHSSFSRGTFTVPNNAVYIKATIPPSSTIINLSSIRNGSYEDYWEATAALPVTTMTGKLNGTGSSGIIFPNGMMDVNGVRDEVKKDGGGLVAIKRCIQLDTIVEKNHFYREDGMIATDELGYEYWNLMSSDASLTPISWNQQILSPNCEDKAHYTVASSDNTLSGFGVYGVFTIGKTTAGSNTISTPVTFEVGHKYLITCEAKLERTLSSKTFYVGQMSAAGAGRTSYFASGTLTTSWKRFSVVTPAYVKSSSYDGIVRLGLRSTITPAGAVIDFRNFNVVDLTAIYGAGNEPTAAQYFQRFTADSYKYNKRGVAFFSSVEYRDLETFTDVVIGTTIYAVRATPLTFVVDDYSVPSNFVWFGMNGSEEQRAETFPWYVSGQGTDTLTVDAMWGEEINVVLRCTKHSATDELSPSKAYAAVTWRIPDVDTHVVSKNGGAVRSDSNTFVFEPICNVKGQTLSTTVINEHLRFQWMYRKSNSTVENEVGWGTTVTLNATDIVNATGVAGKLPSTTVYPYPYLLGAWEPDPSGRTPPYSQPTTTKDGITYVRTIPID